MNPTRTCPKCAAPLPADAPQGHCPQCLLALAVQAAPGDATRAALEQATQDSGSARHGVPPSGGSGGGPAKAGTPNPAPALQFKPGEQVRYFGDYELLEEIARGGMGVVWKARQVSLNRLVAVKMIRAGKFAGEAEVKRFRTEAEAAANLQHPNIVAIHEVGAHEGQHYFSMDYVAGRDLAELVRPGPLPVAQAARYVQAIAGAIAYAHQRGTLHRDLKPHNVLIDQHDQPRITDFGLAKLTQQDSSITQEGAVMGSPSYMPPEQAAGRQAQVGPHSDVYSIGAVLYHLLTGRAPFIGATAVETLRLVMDEEPVAPTKLNAKVPADLETICLKCLRKEPAQRYATAQEVADELGRFLNYEPIQAKPASVARRVWHWTQKNPWVFAATFALLLLVMAGVAFALWEKSRFLAWRMEAGRNAPLPERESAAVLFFMLFPGVCLLLYLAGNSFRNLYRQNLDSGASLPGRHLFSHGALGVLGTVVGMGHLFLQIRSWVWLPSPPLVLAMELAGVVCALVLNWMAVRMVWEAVGIHETSRFRGTVDSALGLQLEMDARRWSGWRLLRLVLWMLLVGGTAFVLHEVFVEEEEQVLVGGSVGLALGFVAGWRAGRAIRQRLRLLFHLFVPAAVGGFVVIVGGLAMTEWEGALTLAVFSVPGFVLGALGHSVFGAKAIVIAGQPRRIPGHPWREALAGLALFLGLFGAFHLIENWRGRHEWQRVKAELEAKGESLDFDTFLKPPVPDEQNMMAHPYMKEHFIRRLTGSPNPHAATNGLSLPLLPFVGPPFALSELKQLPRGHQSMESLSRLVGDRSSSEVIPLLRFTNQPLASVVTELATLAGLKLNLATNGVPWEQPGSKLIPRAGAAKPPKNATVTVLGTTVRTKEQEPVRITRAFTNATALAALAALCDERALTPDAQRWREGQVLDLSLTLQGLLDFFTRTDAGMAELDEAFQRPVSRLTHNRLNPYDSRIPNFVFARHVAHVFSSRAKVHCLVGDPDAALKDLWMLRRTLDAVPANEPPTLVEAMIKVAIAGLVVNVVEETLADGLWPDSHLERVQRACEGVDLLSGVALAFRGGERAGVLRLVETSVEGDKGRGIAAVSSDFGRRYEERYPRILATLLDFTVPDGWVDQNKAHYAHMMQYAVAGLHPETQRVDARAIEAGYSGVATEVEGDQLFRPYSLLSSMSIPYFSKSLSSASKNTTQVNFSFVALALERHRAAKGAYPDTLAALVPEFAAKLPHDLFDGQPLRYRRTPDGKYLLYSIGWNAKDDGGKPDEVVQHAPDGTSTTRYDWVWQGVPKQ